MIIDYDLKFEGAVLVRAKNVPILGSKSESVQIQPLSI